MMGNRDLLNYASKQYEVVSNENKVKCTTTLANGGSLVAVTPDLGTPEAVSNFLQNSKNKAQAALQKIDEAKAILEAEIANIDQSLI
jgi:predicted metal-dependent hydrolase